MLTYRSEVFLLALATLAASASCAATGSSECFLGANTAFEADAAGKRCCEGPDGNWGACPEPMTGSTTSGIGTSTWPTTTIDWTTTTTSTTTIWTTSTTDPLSTTTTTSSSTSLDTDTSSTTASKPVCGNGELDDGEECDMTCGKIVDSPKALADCIADSDCFLDCTWEENKISCSDDSCTATAQCGDGVVNAPKGDKEECDDGDWMNHDGCTNSCAKEWVIFVTKSTYNGNLGGISGADNYCNLAAEGKLDGEYRAWLSATGTDAKGRVPETKEFINTHGDIIVAKGEDLYTYMDKEGGPKHPVGFDENGDAVSAMGDRAWTGTKADGTGEGNYCDEWMWNEMGWKIAYAGDVNLSGQGWTVGGGYGCKSEYHLYCFRADE